MSPLDQILNFIGSLLNNILEIRLPWFSLKFGQIIVGVVFINILIGVFKSIFTSLTHSGGDIKND